MKVRTAKKRIHRHIKWFAKHKIPLSFKNGRERRAWVKKISDWHIAKLKSEYPVSELLEIVKCAVEQHEQRHST